VAAVRIINVAVEGIGASEDGRNLLMGRGRDAARGWQFAFVVPAAHADHVVTEVRAGRQPVIPVPEVDAIPWQSVPAIRWE
jgi:hypothetical protein